MNSYYCTISSRSRRAVVAKFANFAKWNAIETTLCPCFALAYKNFILGRRVAKDKRGEYHAHTSLNHKNCTGANPTPIMVFSTQHPRMFGDKNVFLSPSSTEKVVERIFGTPPTIGSSAAEALENPSRWPAGVLLASTSAAIEPPSQQQGGPSMLDRPGPFWTPSLFPSQSTITRQGLTIPNGDEEGQRTPLCCEKNDFIRQQQHGWIISIMVYQEQHRRIAQKLDLLSPTSIFHLYHKLLTRPQPSSCSRRHIVDNAALAGSPTQSYGGSKPNREKRIVVARQA